MHQGRLNVFAILFGFALRFFGHFISYMQLGSI